MEYRGAEKRKEPRYPIAAEATIRPIDGGEGAPARTVNLSGAGVLLRFERPLGLRVGQQVICEVTLPDAPGKPLPSWGLGTVVRVDDSCAAIELQAGSFDPAPAPDDSGDSIPRTG